LVAIMIVITAFISNGCSKAATITPTPYPPPISSVSLPELSTDFPKNLRWLTDEEKAKITEIALNTDLAKECRQKESQYKTAIDWYALNPDPSGQGYSGYTRFEYDTVAKGIPRGTATVTDPDSGQTYTYLGVPENAEIYPGVTIWFGEEWVVSVAVDVDSGEVKYEESYPNLSNPNRFKTTTGS
jgi:hypothetical protein